MSHRRFGYRIIEQLVDLATRRSRVNPPGSQTLRIASNAVVDTQSDSSVRIRLGVRGDVRMLDRLVGMIDSPGQARLRIAIDGLIAGGKTSSVMNTWQD